MPSANVDVGPIRLPIDAGPQDGPLYDPTVVGVLEYLGFWIRTALTARIGQQRGPGPDGAALTDACPATNLFPWDHENTFIRRHADGAGGMQVPLPGLWGWVEEEEWSEDWSSLDEDCYERRLRIDYVFPELQIPDGFMSRSGVAGAAGMAIRAALSERYHPAFGLGGDAVGTRIDTSLNLRNIRFLSGNVVPLASTARASVLAGGSPDGFVKRFHPAYQATIAVVEANHGFQADPVADAPREIVGTLRHDGLPVLERLISPDAPPDP